MNFDFDRVWESKREMRRKLAALPIAEKLRMLDALRERALILRSESLESVRGTKEQSTDPSRESGS